jgi:hypothetical protein
VVLWYHGLSEVNSFVSLLVSNPRYDSPGGFPFESVGLAALLILFVMAATSHDFWNGVLGLGLGAAFPSPGPGAWDQGKKLAVTGTLYSSAHAGPGIRPPAGVPCRCGQGPRYPDPPKDGVGTGCLTLRAL